MFRLQSKHSRVPRIISMSGMTWMSLRSSTGQRSPWSKMQCTDPGSTATCTTCMASMWWVRTNLHPWHDLMNFAVVVSLVCLDFKIFFVWWSLKRHKNAVWFRWCGSYDPIQFRWSTYLSYSKWPQRRVWSKGQEELSDHLSWDDPSLLAHSDTVQLLIELNYIKVFYHIVRLQWKILCRWKASKSVTASFSSVSEVLRLCGCPCRRYMDRRQHRWVGASEDLSPHVSEHELGWNPFLWW